jgi:hypothetical protein
VGFEPTILVFERAKRVHVSYSAATVIGFQLLFLHKIIYKLIVNLFPGENWYFLLSYVNMNDFITARREIRQTIREYTLEDRGSISVRDIDVSSLPSPPKPCAMCIIEGKVDGA